ncbi:MAG: amidohydrolase family protein, partial [Thermoanaerobaculia bacterium]
MKIYRARLFTPVSDPFTTGASASFVAHEDGFMAVDRGRITGVGEWDRHPEGDVIDLGRKALISPGFVDTHLHAPQLEMIGSYGGHLLEWLNRYTFPTEAKFADPQHARRVARALFAELLRNGTLTALIFSTIHFEATDIFFEEAEDSGFRGIIGKTMMDRNAPEFLLENVHDSYEQSRALLKKWHNRGLLRYAVTPRFAPTSTPALLEAAGSLKKEFADVYVHTHIS